MQIHGNGSSQEGNVRAGGARVSVTGQGMVSSQTFGLALLLIVLVQVGTVVYTNQSQQLFKRDIIAELKTVFEADKKELRAEILAVMDR